MTARPAYETDRPDVRRHVPAGARRVLDLGCAAGAVGAALKATRPGLHVTGVERDPAYAATARTRLDAVLQADLSRPDALAALRTQIAAGDVGGPGRRFDVLLAADVLEHLPDPDAALHAATALLTPGATVIVSLPNVRYWETFWQLGRHGRWPRRSVGLFDRTHLRWFALADAHDLVTGAGLTVRAVDRRLLRPDGQPWPLPVAGLAPRVPGLRTLLALQHVIVATAP